MKKRLSLALLSVVILFSSLAPAVLSENLKYGMENTQVKQAQVRLKALGFYSGVADGKFGYLTYRGVFAFQTKNGLKVDGVIGEDTILKLYSASAVNAAGADVTTPYAMRIGFASEGPAVTQIQDRLRQTGYYRDAVDGKFGYLTFLAVKAFQAANSLQVDGIVGPQTWTKLLGSAAPAPVPTDTPSAPLPDPAAPPAGLWVQYGNSGGLVTQLQTKLQSLNYYQGAADGNFGYSTYLAVRSFQRANGIQVDGIVGQVTWSKMFGPGAVPAAGAPAPVPTDAPFRLQYGNTEPLVGQTKTKLAARDYTVGGGGDLFDYTTYLAIRSFQHYNGLKRDGVVGPNTWAALMGPSPVAHP